MPEKVLGEEGYMKIFSLEPAERAGKKSSSEGIREALAEEQVQVVEGKKLLGRPSKCSPEASANDVQINWKREANW